VSGRQLPLSLIQHVVTQPEEELYRLLSSLQSKEFLYEQPAFPEVEYIFKHALTQEVAYGTVLQDKRKALHERTAQAIETLYHAQLDDHYGDLAHHYSRSGNTQKAADYLQLAGQQAVQRSANAEAIAHLTTALELLKTLPDTPERARQELILQIALGVPLTATRSWGAPEVEQTYSRARELCQQVGETPQLFQVLYGLWLYYEVRAELQTAHELGEQCLKLAQSVQDPALLLVAHFTLGLTLFWLGELALAREHFEQGIALYDLRQHRSLAFVYGSFDPGVACLASVGWILWVLGYPDQALKRVHEALTLAQELTHPVSVALALHFVAALHQHRREGRAVQERAETYIALSSEQGFPYWLATGTILRGWALAEQGQREEGVGQMRQGVAVFRATGSEIGRSWYLALLTEACGRTARTEEGLNLLTEALVHVHKYAELLYEAELYRLRGELTLAQSSVQGLVSSVQKEAEECFLKAIEIARRQQAKSLELRATVSLARLWQQQSKKEEAHRMLVEIYGCFTEGFDTKDLQEAKALLAELS